ncbi:hypothetical protein ABPG74_006723 [Tetrahymena malaccensis]
MNCIHLIQIKERARQFVDDNIEDFYTKGLFNELIQEELQDQLVQFKYNYGNQNHPSLKTVNQPQNQQYFQKMKTNQNIQNQFSNIKIQHQKVKNLIANIQDNQSMKNYSELYTLDKTIQFSINLLQEDNLGDNKSIQVLSSQFINNNNIPVSFHHYQIIVGDCINLNTPTNREIQQSNLSDSFPQSINKNIYVNVNSVNYNHQNNRQNNINNQTFMKQHYSQANNYYINDIMQQYAYYDSSNQLSKQDTYNQEAQNQQKSANEINNSRNKKKCQFKRKHSKKQNFKGSIDQEEIFQPSINEQIIKQYKLKIGQ